MSQIWLFWIPLTSLRQIARFLLDQQAQRELLFFIDILFSLILGCPLFSLFVRHCTGQSQVDAEGTFDRVQGVFRPHSTFDIRHSTFDIQIRKMLTKCF